MLVISYSRPFREKSVVSWHTSQQGQCPNKKRIRCPRCLLLNKMASLAQNTASSSWNLQPHQSGLALPQRTGDVSVRVGCIGKPPLSISVSKAISPHLIPKDSLSLPYRFFFSSHCSHQIIWQAKSLNFRVTEIFLEVLLTRTIYFPLTNSFKRKAVFLTRSYEGAHFAHHPHPTTCTHPHPPTPTPTPTGTHLRMHQ